MTINLIPRDERRKAEHEAKIKNLENERRNLINQKLDLMMEMNREEQIEHLLQTIDGFAAIKFDLLIEFLEDEFKEVMISAKNILAPKE